MAPGDLPRPAGAPVLETVKPRKKGRGFLKTLVLGLFLLVIVGALGFGVGYLIPTLLVQVPAAAKATPTPTPVPTPTQKPLPTPEPTPTAAPTPTAEPTPEPTPKLVIYTVKAGDQLLRIAKQFGVTQEEIMKLNGIKDPNKILIGQKLKIPPKPKASASPTP